MFSNSKQSIHQIQRIICIAYDHAKSKIVYEAERTVADSRDNY